VCAHKAVSALRRRTVEQKALGRLRARPEPPAGTTSGDEAFWSLVRRLPARQAQVVCLHYALDLGIAEVAATLGCAEGTVKAHLSRARAALARVLIEEDDR
jgi:RNA polymerase sigma-70 factor (ECF subfamily)